MATNIYPRGTTQWWRRSVHFVAVLNDPITIRMSLKTRCPREARARAGYLEMEMKTVEMSVAKDLRTRIGLAEVHEQDLIIRSMAACAAG